MEQGIFWRGRTWRIAGGDEGDNQAGQQPQTGDGTGQQGQAALQQNAGGDERKFSQAELDAIVKDRLDRERRAAETKAQKEREAAEQKALEEQAKFKELADERAKKLAELEPLQAKAERYEQALTKLLEAQRKDLPAHITALLDKLDPAEQLEWIAANQEAIRPAAQQGAASTPNTPKANGQPTREQLVERTKQELKASGRYLL